MDYREVIDKVREIGRSSPTQPCYDCGRVVQMVVSVLCSYCKRMVCDPCYTDHAAGTCLTRVGASHRE